MIELRATGLIYRDSTLHAWHPTLALLPNGDLLAAYDLGETIGALDYCTYLCTLDRWRPVRGLNQWPFSPIPLPRPPAAPSASAP